MQLIPALSSGQEVNNDVVRHILDFLPFNDFLAFGLSSRVCDQFTMGMANIKKNQFIDNVVMSLFLKKNPEDFSIFWIGMSIFLIPKIY